MSLSMPTQFPKDQGKEKRIGLSCQYIDYENFVDWKERTRKKIKVCIIFHVKIPIKFQAFWIGKM